MRVHLHIDVALPKAVLVVNGKELKLSEDELESLYGDVVWAKKVIADQRKQYFKSLTDKYKEKTL